MLGIIEIYKDTTRKTCQKYPIATTIVTASIGLAAHVIMKTSAFNDLMNSTAKKANEILTIKAASDATDADEPMLMASVEASALASADVIETSSPGANVYVNEEHDGAFVQSILTQKGSRANNTHISKSIVFSSDEVESDGASSSNNAILLAENKNINDSCVVNLSNGAKPSKEYQAVLNEGFKNVASKMWDAEKTKD